MNEKGHVFYECKCGGMIYEEWDRIDPRKVYRECNRCSNYMQKEPSGIDLARFGGSYSIKLVDTVTAETIRSFDFSYEEIGNGIMRDGLRGSIKAILSPNRVVEGIKSAICNVYVNGIIVNNLRSELGLY